MKRLKNIVTFLFIASMGVMTAPVFADTYPSQAEIEKEEQQGFHLESFLNQTKTVVNQYIKEDKKTSQALNLFLANLEGAYEMKMISKDDLTRVCDALVFATIKNKDIQENVYQMITIANNIMNIAGSYDPSIIIAALLKEVVDSKNMNLDDINTKFGPKIKDIIAEIQQGKDLSLEAAQLEVAEDLVYLNNVPKDISEQQQNEQFLAAQEKADHLSKDVGSGLKKAINEKVKNYFDKK